MLDRITPVILTYNEAPNIGRTLERLRWAREIVVVDSGSTDETSTIIARFANARLVYHPMTSLADQLNFGFHEMGIVSDWVLRLDADYIVTDELVEEISRLDPAPEVAAYRVNFLFAVHGVRLRAHFYPPEYGLFRRRGLEAYQDGHAVRFRYDGEGQDLKARIIHDDRKPISHWLWSQGRYMAIETAKLASAPPGSLDLIDRIRKRRVLAPILMLFYCLFVKRLILDGRAGFYYAFQRTAAEMILSLHLLDADLRDPDG